MKTIAILAAILFVTPVFAAEQIHVVEHAKTDATSHVGKAADNRGDILTFANPVFDAADKTQVGSDQGFCIRVVTGKAFECL